MLFFYGIMAKRKAHKSTGVSVPALRDEDPELASVESSPKGSESQSSSPRSSETPLDNVSRDDNDRSPSEKSRFPVFFSDLFKDNRKFDEASKCSFIPPNPSGAIEIPESDVAPVHDIWGSCLLGCFAGRFPGLKALQSLVDTWKVKCSIMAHYNGWILFQFEHEQEMNKVLAEGPYFVFGRGLLLRSPPENFCFLDEDFSIVPVWIQLHNLPLQCWTNKAISRIASKVGNPLCTDRITQERKRISYARVLVEIDASKDPCEEFEVTLPSGISYMQYVEYENLPKYCKYCHMFSHYEKTCKFKLQDKAEGMGKTNERQVPGLNPSPLDEIIIDNTTIEKEPLNSSEVVCLTPTNVPDAVVEKSTPADDFGHSNQGPVNSEVERLNLGYESTKDTGNELVVLNSDKDSNPVDDISKKDS